MIPTFSKPNFYGRRHGRTLGSLKKELMEKLLPRVHLAAKDAATLVQNAPYAVLEIGFGGGEHLADFALNNPDITCLGVEVFKNGIASLLQKIHLQGIENIRIFPEDVRLLFPLIQKESLDHIFVLFPDPWPKKKHHFRRLLTPETFSLFVDFLKPHGRLTIASDDPSYLEQIHECMAQRPQLSLFLKDRTSVYQRPQNWTITKYEEKALKAGRIPEYFTLEKKHL